MPHQHGAIADLDIDGQQCAVAARPARTFSGNDIEDCRVVDAHNVLLVWVDELTAIAIQRQKLMRANIDIGV